MKVERKPHEWEPVIITIESRDELEALKAAIGTMIGAEKYLNTTFNYDLHEAMRGMYREVRYL